MVKRFNAPEDATLQEENVLLLDKVRFRLEDGSVSEVRDILKTDDKITSEIEDPVKLALELPEDCKIFLNDQSVDVTSIGYYVDEAISVIQLPNLTVGKNELRLQIGFHQKINLESMYLLGDFGVELCGTETALILLAYCITVILS